MGAGLYVLIGIFLIGLVALSALFSFSEMAISSANKTRLLAISNSDKSSKKEKKQAKRVIHFIENYNEHISAIVIFNNIVNILFTTLSTVYFTLIAKNLMDNDTIGPLMSFLIMTPVVIIFGEIVPKQLAKRYPEQGTMKLSWTLQIVNMVMKPITFVLSKIIKEEEKTLLNSDEEITLAIAEATNAGVTNSFEQMIINRSLEIDNMNIGDVMIPLKDVATIDFDTTKTKLNSTLKKTSFTRFPMIDENKNVKAIFSAKKYLIDKLKGENKDLVSYVYDYVTFNEEDNPFYIFEALRNRREKMAIILNNNGLFSGIITIEDIIELMLGQIYDEDDVEKDGVYTLNETAFLVKPNVKISYLNSTYLKNITFSAQDKKMTIKKWVESIAKEKLKPGKHYTYKNIIIWVKQDKKIDKNLIFEIDVITQE